MSSQRTRQSITHLRGSRAITVALLTMLACMVSGSLGCKKALDELKKAGKAADKAAGNEASGDTTESDKSNAYIECSNRFTSRAYQARDRYLSWVDAKTGPTGKEKIVYGTYSLVGDVASECRGRLNKVKGGPAMPELDKAAEDMTAALEALAPLLEDANSYYSNNGYKADDMKKGKELHPKLMAAFDAFAAAQSTMSAQLDILEDKNLAKQLAELEKQDEKGPYLMTKVIASGKKLIGVVNKIEDIKKVDLASYQPALTAFTTAVEELTTYARSHAEEVGPEVTDFARSSASKVVAQGNALLGRVKNKTPLSSGDEMMINAGNPQMVEGHPSAIIDAYNDMIEASNRM